MTTPKRSHQPRFWDEFDPSDRLAGAKLADLYRGIGETAGTVPSMWRHHRVDISSGTAESGLPDRQLTAEHQALTLFALHQQSQSRSMHWTGVGLGKALYQLRHDQRTSAEALDRQVKALVTADDTDELYDHLRSLIPRLKTLEHGSQGLDYTKLYYDLRDWSIPQRQDRIRLVWGAQYSNWDRRDKPQPNNDNQ